MNGGMMLSFVFLSAPGNIPSALRSPIHLGCVYRVTNLLSPLTFSKREAERRESEQGHPSNHAPMMVMCSECHFM
jgi:hypothetical protein